MKRSLGRNWGRAAWTFAWLLLGGGAMAQTPEQHWQATPNYPPNYPPNYQPSTAPAGPPATGNPAARPPRRRDNINIRSSPINPSARRSIRRSSAVSPPRPASRPTGNQPPDNRAAYPQQDPRGQGVAGQGQRSRVRRSQGSRSKVLPCGTPRRKPRSCSRPRKRRRWRICSPTGKSGTKRSMSWSRSSIAGSTTPCSATAISRRRPTKAS